MKFKAKITDPGGYLLLERIATTFLKVSRAKRCKLRLTPKGLQLALLVDVGTDRCRMWAEARQDMLFETYRLESLHPNNEVLLEISLEHFCRALRSAANGCTSMVMRLTKRDHTSYLSVTVNTQSAAGTRRPIVQDVPVKVFPHDEASDTTARLPSARPAVQLYLPDTKTMKSIVEKMKMISDKLVVAANNAGALVFKVDQSVVSAKTSFRDLQNVPWREGEEPDTNGGEDGEGDEDGEHTSFRDRPEEFAQARIQIKHMDHFLSGYQIKAGDLVMSIMPSKAIILMLHHDEISFTCHVPHVSR